MAQHGRCKITDKANLAQFRDDYRILVCSIIIDATGIAQPLHLRY